MHMEYGKAFKESIAEFEETLESNCGKNIGWFVKVSVLAGFAASIAAIAILFALDAPNLYITTCAILAFAAPLLLHFFLQHYLFEINKRKKEAIVPDMLLQASAFPNGTGFERIIEYFSNERFGLLGGEFKKARREIEKGSTVQRALDNMASRCKSSIIERAMLLLKQGYGSGADMGSVFRESADDLLETNAILRERNAALVIEKYTLLLAGGIIVPAVLGLLVSMVSSMDFSALEMLEFGRSIEEKETLLQAAVAANQIYIIEYSLLASFFVAYLEGNPKKALLYALFLLPLSLLFFNAAKWFLGFA